MFEKSNTLLVVGDGKTLALMKKALILTRKKFNNEKFVESIDDAERTLERSDISVLFVDIKKNWQKLLTIHKEMSLDLRFFLLSGKSEEAHETVLKNALNGFALKTRDTEEMARRLNNLLDEMPKPLALAQLGRLKERA